MTLHSKQFLENLLYCQPMKILLYSISFGATLFLTGCTSAITDTFNKAKDLKATVENINVQLSEGGAGHVVIVPGYGAPVSGNSTYEDYIDEVAEFVNDESNAVETVVFTGSYSSLENTSEAESMNSYYNSTADLDDIKSRGIKVYKEECAIVSWQNISNTHELLVDNNIPYGHVTIFGDENREDKLTAFGTYAFNNDINIPGSASELVNSSLSYSEIDFIGFDFGDDPVDQNEQDAKFAAEIAGAYDAQIGNEILEARINEWTNEFGYDVADNLVSKGCTEFAGFQ